MRLEHTGCRSAAVVIAGAACILRCINTALDGNPVARPSRTRMITMIKTLAAKFHAWKRFRDSVRELERLSDRELSDLGIYRADIEEVVRQGAPLQG